VHRRLREAALPREVAPAAARAYAALCARAYVANAAFARQLAAGWNARAVFLQQPTGELMEGAERHPFPQGGPLPGWRVAYFRELYARVGSEAARRGLHVRDLSRALDDAFRRGEPLFVTQWHLNARGNALMAEKIRAAILELIPSAPPAARGRAPGTRRAGRPG
jgi:hypothetical protein